MEKNKNEEKVEAENITEQPIVKKPKEKTVKTVFAEQFEKLLKNVTITTDKQGLKTIKTTEGAILGYMKDARYGIRFYLLTGSKEALIQIKTNEDTNRVVSFITQIQKQITGKKLTFKDGDFESTKKAEIVKHLLG
jgi:hypothetical protein